MTLLDSVHEKTSQTLLNHAEIHRSCETLTTDYLSASYFFFNDQFPVCVHVYENESYIASHFVPHPHFRILA